MDKANIYHKGGTKLLRRFIHQKPTHDGQFY